MTNLSNGKAQSYKGWTRYGLANEAGKRESHGQRKTKLYDVWSAIIDRCENPNNKRSERYSEKGITICKEWRESFTSFQKWAEANGYQEGLTIDRNDNDGNYCPGNCSWKGRGPQARNKSNSKWWTVNGKTYDAAIDAAKDLGVSKTTILQWCEGRNGKYPSEPKPGCFTELKYPS